MPEVKIHDQTIIYTLRLDKRRKSIQLRVLPTAVVELVAPARLTAAEVAEIFTAKRKWLTARLEKIAALSINPVNQQLLDGAPLLYQGEPYVLRIIPGCTHAKVQALPGELQVKLPPHDSEHPQAQTILAQIIKAWFVDQAGRLFFSKTNHWAARIGVRPARITIKDQKTRWGSCSSLGNINYNWRVIMAPPVVMDYLVVHELCHLLVPNHSDKFWQQVSRFLPEYRQCRTWLTENGKLLSRLF